MKKIAALTVMGTLILALAGCGSSRRDLNGVPNRDPDKAEMYSNVDGYPNIVRVCIGGVAFATTTRQMGEITRVPEWDKTFCA
jgi:hypothetical protein